MWLNPSLDMILKDHHQILMNIFSTFEEGKKLKQTEAQVNIMIKMKTRVLMNLKFMLNWQTVLIKLWAILTNRDTLWWQQRDFGLCETLISKNLRRSSLTLLDVRIKLVITFKVGKLTSLKYFELQNRVALFTEVSIWFKIL